MSELEDLITFVWWNVSLSYKDKPLLDDKSKGIVWDVVNDFVANDIGFIGFAEVAHDSINDLKSFCDFNEYEVETACDAVGKTKFDLCFIYKRDRFTLLHREKLSALINDQTYKIGARFDLALTDGGEVFHIIISHWASRLRGGGEKRRGLSAQKLREHIDLIKSKYTEFTDIAPYILLMGDYNDDPFNESLSTWLMGTRDREIVKKKRDLLYNPFWGELATKNGFSHAGSYYYASGDITKWHTFDQMLYSHAFLGVHDWEIAHEMCKILPLPDILSLVTSSASKLDHLPIIGAVKRKKLI